MSSFLFLTSYLVILMSVVAQDDRCLLESGGSTLRFLAAEDLSVGGVVGKIGVQGKVGEDIQVTLTDTGDSILQVEVRNQSAVLILGGPLDREGVAGPSSLVTSVLCQRLTRGDRGGEEADPGFVIPINVRVTDINDNAPQFLGAPYTVNISEVTQVGSQILQVEAVDADQRGPFSSVEYLVEQGQYSDYLDVDRDGLVTLVRPLDYEKVTMLEVRLKARDKGDPAQYTYTMIKVHVEDADDQNPVFHHDRYEALLPDDPVAGSMLSVLPDHLLAYDKDMGINSTVYYTFSGSGSQYKLFNLNSSTGQVFLASNVSEDDLPQPLTLIVQATQQDNNDRYSITTLTISRQKSSHLSPDIAFSSHQYTGQVLENMPVDSVVMTLVTNKPNLVTNQFYIFKGDLPGREFEVNAKGEIILKRALDYETIENYSFHVSVTDGKHNDMCSVNISVINVNDWDPRFKYPQYEFFVTNEATKKGQIVGVVDVFDGDTDDEISLDLTGHSARVFGITANGEIYITDLSFLTGEEAHIVVTAEDSGSPPRRASVPVIIKFDNPSYPGASPRELVNEGPNMMMIIILCSVSSIFILIIISLGIVICKTKRRLKSASPILTNSDTDSMYLQQNSGQFPSQIGSVNLSYKLDPSLTTRASRPSSSVSDKSGVTMASLISMSQSQQPTSLMSNTSVPSNSTNTNNMVTFGRKQVKHKSNKVTPQDLEADINECGLPGYSPPQHDSQRKKLQQQLKTNILHNSNSDRRLEWPRGSIPRTVKKLSWDDETIDNVHASMDRLETRDREVPVLMDVNVALTPLERNKTTRMAGDTVYLESIS